MKTRLRKLLNKLTKKRVVVSAIYLSLFAISASGSYVYFSLAKVHVSGEELSPTEETISVAEVPEDDPTTNVLLLGMGGQGHPGGTLSDANLLVHIDVNNKKAAIITIPRDLWVPIPGTGGRTTFNKLNKAYALGGGEVSKQVVSSVTGLKVDKFIAVDFVGFQRIIGLLGGITVNAPEDYDDYFYPIKGRELDLCGMSPQEIQEVHEKYTGFQLEKQFECRYEHIHFEKGEQEMEGAVALKYVRSRHGDSDFGRAKRQAVVLEGLKEKLVSLEIVKNSPKLLDAIVDNVRTDISIEELKDFHDLVASPNEYETITIHLTEDNVLTSSNGASGFILIPKQGNNNWASMHKYISEQMKN